MGLGLDSVNVQLSITRASMPRVEPVEEVWLKLAALRRRDPEHYAEVGRIGEHSLMNNGIHGVEQAIKCAARSASGRLGSQSGRRCAILSSVH